MHAVSRELDYVASTLQGLHFAGSRFRSFGKAKAGRRPASWGRCDDQRASMGRHDLLNDRQAKSIALFGGVARLERFDALGAWRDSSAVVADRHAPAI